MFSLLWVVAEPIGPGFLFAVTAATACQPSAAGSETTQSRSRKVTATTTADHGLIGRCAAALGKTAPADSLQRILDPGDDPCPTRRSSKGTPSLSRCRIVSSYRIAPLPQSPSPGAVTISSRWDRRAASVWECPGLQSVCCRCRCSHSWRAGRGPRQPGPTPSPPARTGSCGRAPHPVADLGQVLAVLVDVVFVLDQLIPHLLLQVRAPGA